MSIEGVARAVITTPLSKPKLTTHFLALIEDLGVNYESTRAHYRHEEGVQRRSVQFLRHLKPIIDKKDETAFGLLVHIAENASDDEIRDTLYFHPLLDDASYLEAAVLIRQLESTRFLAGFKNWAKTEVAPHTYRLHRAPQELQQQCLAVMQVIHAVCSVREDTLDAVGSPDYPLSLYGRIGRQPCLTIQHRDLLALALDNSDNISPVTAVIRNHGVISAPHIRSILGGGAASLSNGAL
jgi:hypothetical protein